MVLQSLNPVLLLGESLPAFFFVTVDELRDLVSQSFIFHVTGVREGRADGRDDSRPKGSCMQGWLQGSSCCGRGVEKVGATLDEVCFSGHRKKGGSMLFSTWVVTFKGGSDKVIFDCSGWGWLTWRLTHSLGAGVVFVVGVATEARVLEGVFALGGVKVRLR